MGTEAIEQTAAEVLKAQIKKLSSQAVKAKMDLHDLAEDLPINWQSILDVATHAYNTYQQLDSLKAQFREAE